MGIVQKGALYSSIISYVGLFLGYFNKGFLFILLLSTEEIGVVNLTLAIGALFAQFANLGAFNSIWRFFPIVRNEKRAHYGFLMFSILFALAGAAILTTLVLIFRDTIVEYYSQRSEAFIPYFYWVIPAGVGGLLYSLLDGYLRALDRSVFSVFTIDVGLRSMTTIMLVLFATHVFAFDQLVIGICLAEWIPVVVLVIYLKTIGEWHFSFRKMAISRKLRKIIYKYSAFSYINSLGATIVVSIDTLMIAGMLGLSQTGIYTTIVFVTRALTIPYSSIIRVSAPIIPRLWKERNMPEMQKLYSQVSSVSLAIGMYLFLGVWVCRQELFEIFPPEFKEGINVFLFLMIGRLLDMYFGLNGIILISSKKYRYDMIFTGILIVTVFLLNLWLIDDLGITGAAISSCIAYVIYNLLRMSFVYFSFGLHPFRWSQLKVMLLFGIVITSIELMPIQFGNIWINILAKGALATLLFPGIMYWRDLEPELTGYFNKIRNRFLPGK